MENAADLLLRRKWTLKAHGRQVVFIKNVKEHSTHVLMKAFLWALYLPDYPTLSVEIGINDRYQPDVMARASDGQPLFWGEAGHVGIDKIRALARRYRHTHFAIAKWQSSLTPLAAFVREAVVGLHRSAPFDLLRFPENSVERFIDDHGCIHLTRGNIEWVRIA